jgi:hypothetical protein
MEPTGPRVDGRGRVYGRVHTSRTPTCVGPMRGGSGSGRQSVGMYFMMKWGLGGGRRGKWSIGRGGETYRGGRGGDEAEAVVELKLDVPFREVLRGPFNHVLCLTVFSLIILFNINVPSNSG